MRPRYYVPLLLIQFFWTAALLAGSISGTVTKRDNGTPIAGAQILAVKVPFDSTFGHAVSDSMGNYAITGLPAGQYHMRAQVRDMVIEDSALVTVTADGAVPGVNFAFGPPPHPLSNTVTGRISSKADHHGISGAVAHLEFGAALSVDAVADSAGRFSFANLTPGWYTFAATAEGYEAFHADHQFMVGADSHISGLNVELRPLVNFQTVITGHVYDSVSGAPVTGAVVFDNIYTLRFDSLHQHFAWTDSSGAYTFRNVAPGTYILSCKAEGYLPAAKFGIAVANNETTSVDFLLKRPATGTIAGTVIVGTEPYAGARLQFVPTQNMPAGPDRGAVTDSTGAYSAPLGVGSYYVACEVMLGRDHAWKWYSTGGGERTAVTIAENSITSGIDFAFTPPRSLHVSVSGTVTDAGTGAPIKGARVSAGIDSMLACSDNDGVASTRTDSAGNYILTLNVYARESFRFALSSRAPGYQVEYFNETSDPSQATVFAVSSDSALTGVNFTLDTIQHVRNSISGSVTTSSGAPLPGVLVSAHGRITREYRVAVTDSLGNYSIGNLFNERYVVFFAARGFVGEFYDDAHAWEDATPVLAQGNVSGINASLDSLGAPDSLGGGTIVGTVYDDHDSVLAGATIWLVRDGIRVWRSTTTLSDGSYSFEHVFPGFFTLVAGKPGYKTASAGVTLTANDSGAVTVNFTLEFKAPTATVNVSGGWNIVSIPMHVGNGASGALFPGFGGSFFQYAGNSYGTPGQLGHGRGYWMKNVDAGSYDIEGGAVLAETVQVQTGWNLIGALSLPIAVADIKATTPGFVVSQFFGYNGNAYSATDTLYPGFGYWLKVASAGTLIISLENTPGAKPVTVAKTMDAPPAAPEAAASGDARPKSFSLGQNYPNPFNPTTQVQYDLPASGIVMLKVYNVLGVEVATLVNGVQDAGTHQITWDASNLASGVYFYKLTAGANSSMKKMMLLR